MSNATDVTIAILGAGGRYWAPTVLRDLALSPDLTGKLRLHSRHLGALDKTAEVAETLFSHPDARTRFEVSCSTSLEETLNGADFVFIGISPGPAAMFANDLEITEQFGVLHTVGDTTGPAGISRALRAIPIFAEFARAVGEHCPNAWVVNFANPLTLCTAALYDVFPDIKAFGCCHEVAGTKRLLAQLISRELGGPAPAANEISLDIAGVNHFTFATAAHYQGESLFPFLQSLCDLPETFADASGYAAHNSARGAFWDHKAMIGLDMFRRFGVLGAAGDRHLAEFVPWYLSAGEAGLHRWGVVATPASFRAGTWQPAAGVQVAANPLDASGVPEHLVASGEEAVAQVCALLGLSDLDTNVNLPNSGQISQLPIGAIVETNAQFRHGTVRPVTTTPLPDAVAPLVARICEVQALTLRAALACDFDLALQAILLDPLCMIAPDRAADMLKTLVAANRELLLDW